MCLHSNEDMQLLDLRSVIASTTRNTKSGRDWIKIRQQLLWLRDWQSGEGRSGPAYYGLFWRIPRDVVETEILKALLEVRGKYKISLCVCFVTSADDTPEYNLAVGIYTDSMAAPLQTSQVETAVRDAIFTSYDNASNGNRTRGGMKRAYDM